MNSYQIIDIKVPYVVCIVIEDKLSYLILSYLILSYLIMLFREVEESMQARKANKAKEFVEVRKKECI
jgi:hypothetical protein